MSITYDGNNPFGDVTPFVGLSREAIRYQHRWGTVDRITLTGQIINDCGELGYGGASAFYQKKIAICEAFSSNFKPLNINVNGASYFAEVAYVRSISFDESNFATSVPYSIEIQCYQEDTFIGQYGVLDPVNEFSFEEGDDRTITVNQNISASGFNTAGVGALQNAINFCQSASSDPSEWIGTLFLDSVVSTPVLLTENESLNRLSGTYSIQRQWVYDPYLSGDGILRYSVDSDYNLETGVTIISLDGSLSGGKNINIDQLRGRFLNTNFYDIASSAFADVSLNLLTEQKNVEEDPFQKIISFSFTWDNDPNEGLNYLISGNYDAQSGITSVSVEGSLTGDRLSTMQELRAKLNSYNFYSLASAEFPEITLNTKEISKSIGENEKDKTISFSFTWNNSPNLDEGLGDLIYTIEKNCTQDSGITSVSISGSLTDQACGEVTIGQLRDRILNYDFKSIADSTAAPIILNDEPDSQSISDNELDKSISFSFVWSNDPSQLLNYETSVSCDVLSGRTTVTISGEISGKTCGSKTIEDLRQELFQVDFFEKASSVVEVDLNEEPFEQTIENDEVGKNISFSYSWNDDPLQGLNYQISHSCDNESGITSVSVNGEISDKTCGTKDINELRQILLDVDFWQEISVVTSANLNQEVVSQTIENDELNKRIIFNFNWDDDPQRGLIYSLSHTCDADSGVTTVSISGEITDKTCGTKTIEDLRQTISEVDFFEKALGVTSANLNLDPVEETFTEKEVEKTISFSYSWNDDPSFGLTYKTTVSLDSLSGITSVSVSGKNVDKSCSGNSLFQLREAIPSLAELFNIASSETEAILNVDPISTSISEDKINSQIDFSFTWDNNPAENLSYEVSCNYDQESGVYKTSVNGQVFAKKCDSTISMEVLRGLVPTESQAKSFVEDTFPSVSANNLISSSIEEDEANKQISFSYSWDDEEQSLYIVDDNTNVNYDYITGKGSVSVSVTWSMKKNCECDPNSLWEDLKNAADSFSLYDWAKTKWVQYLGSGSVGLNENSVSGNINEDEETCTISKSAAFESEDGVESNYLSKFNYNISISYGMPQVGDSLTICKDQHILNYLGYYERTSFTISGSALVKDCGSPEQGFSEVKSKISELVNIYVKGSYKQLDVSSVEKDLDNQRFITFSETWSSNLDPSSVAGISDLLNPVLS